MKVCPYNKKFPCPHGKDDLNWMGLLCCLHPADDCPQNPLSQKKIDIKIKEAAEYSKLLKSERDFTNPISSLEV